MDNIKIISFKNELTIYFCSHYDQESGNVVVTHKIKGFYMNYDCPLYGALPLVFRNREVFDKFKEIIDSRDIKFLENPDVEIRISDSENKVMHTGDECYFVDYTYPLRGKEEEKEERSIQHHEET